jgi:hypothetical protein
MYIWVIFNFKNSYKSNQNSNYMGCLTNIVGVTASTTIPFYDELSEELQTAIATSEGDKYLDTLTGGIDLNTIDDVDYMNMVLNDGVKACAEASKVLNDELLVALNNRYQASKPKFIGDIGRMSFSGNLSYPTKYHGMRLRCNEPIAGNIRISRIKLGVNGAATFNVYIARCDSRNDVISEILHTLEVTTVPSVMTNIDISGVTGGIVLPMEINGVEQEYYIFYNRDEASGLYPKNNEIKCGTCTSANRAMDMLRNFVHATGVYFNDQNDLPQVASDSYAHGFVVTATIGCEHESVICREYAKKEAMSLVMATAAQLKAGELWIEYIFKSGYVNKTNLQNREYLWGKRNHFRAEFDKRITVLATSMTVGETNCYTCKDEVITKGLIRA